MNMISAVLYLSSVVLATALDVSLNTSDITKRNISSGADLSGVAKLAVNLTSNTTLRNASSRVLAYLSPGDEFLLSVTSLEDSKDAMLKSMPHLKNVLQKGKLDIRRVSGENKNGRGRLPAFPRRMVDVRKVMTAMEKADEPESGTVAASPTGFLEKLAADPTTIILAAIIPLSLLLAAVIPLLLNQFTNVPSVMTIASGKGKFLQERQFIENMMPILDEISSFGSRMSEAITKEKTKKRKLSVLQSILQLVTSSINERWIGRLASTSVQRLRSCKGDCSPTNGIL